MCRKRGGGCGWWHVCFEILRLCNFGVVGVTGGVVTQWDQRIFKKVGDLMVFVLEF